MGNKEEVTNQILSCFGIWAYLAIVLVGGTIFQAWIMTILWRWFIVPFFSQPELSIPYAIGLTIIISMFKTVKLDDKEEEDLIDRIFKSIGFVFLVPLWLLLIAWIVKFFI
jgi:hypothetical protein